MLIGQFEFTTALKGDVNADGIVDVFDVLTVKAHLGETPNSPHWNSNIDINEDGNIDVFDILIAKNNLGHTIP